jgi:hypothetical protein
MRVLFLNANPTQHWAHLRQVEVHKGEESTVELYRLSRVKVSSVHGAHSVTDIATVALAATAAAGSSTTTESAPHVSWVAVFKIELLGKGSSRCGSDG